MTQRRISKNVNYLQGLIDYILDVKPYHCKLTEVIEEYQFSDTINVKITDSLETDIKVSSVWEKTYLTDGTRNRILIPSYNLPRYSIENNLHYFTSNNELTYLSTLGITNAYQLRGSTGIESVILNSNEQLVEGIDYFYSLGMYSFTVTKSNNKFYLNDIDGESLDRSLITQVDENNPILIDNIDIPYPAIDNWTITQTGGYFEQSILSNTWQFKHNFLTTDLIWQVYINTPNGLEQALVSNVTITDTLITIHFSIPYTGKLLILNSAENYTQNFNSTNQCLLAHNLNTSSVIVEVISNGNYIIPHNITILSDNLVVVDFNSNISGTVILIKADTSFKQTIPDTTWLIPGNYANQFLPFTQIYIEDNGFYTSVLPNSLILTDTLLTITFNTPQAGFINLNSANTYSVYHKNIFIGLAHPGTRFKNPSINFDILNNSLLGAGARINLLDNITLHEHSESEDWTIVKTNPIAITGLKTHYNGCFTLEVIAKTWPTDFIDYTNNPIWHFLKCDYKFEIIGINNGLYSFRLTNLTDNTFIEDTISIVNDNLSDLYLRLIIGTRPLAIGDYCNFSFGFDTNLYDIDGFDNAEYNVYSSRGLSTQLLPNVGNPLKIIPLGQTYANYYSESYILKFNKGGKYFTVFGSHSGILPILFLGQEYEVNNSRFRLVRTYEPFDIEAFNNSPRSYSNSYSDRAINANELNDGDEFYFTIEKEKPSYLIYGSSSGLTGKATVGSYFWNGKIGFPLKKPIYKVSYNNEIIGIDSNVINFPDNKASITFNNPPKSDINTERLELIYHNEGLDSKMTDGNRQFLVTSSTRGILPSAIIGQRYIEKIDSTNDTISFDFTITDTDEWFTGKSFNIEVISNNLQMNHSADVLILNKPNTGLRVNTYREDLLTLKINTSHPELGSTSSLIPIYIVSNSDNNNYSLGYDGHLTDYNSILYGHILTPNEYKDPTTIIDSSIIEKSIPINNSTELYDCRFELEPFDTVQYDTRDTSFPNKEKNNIPVLPDRGQTFDIFLSNIHYQSEDKHNKVGTISWQYDPDAKMYKQVLDFTTLFMQNYCQLNNQVKIEVQQADKYNDLVRVKFSETLRFGDVRYGIDLFTYETPINISIVDKLYQDEHSGEFKDIGCAFSEGINIVSLYEFTGYDGTLLNTTSLGNGNGTILSINEYSNPSTLVDISGNIIYNSIVESTVANDVEFRLNGYDSPITIFSQAIWAHPQSNLNPLINVYAGYDVTSGIEVFESIDITNGEVLKVYDNWVISATYKINGTVNVFGIRNADGNYLLETEDYQVIINSLNNTYSFVMINIQPITIEIS